ncbi:beta-Ala-His dipeptidase [Hippea alviniae]|uniref:beta-Ala-His dipeptidase n=1 Tax=Hippea alviniae TaxID=1279027 RepID=UPI0003B4ED1E|nr:beta-Ala-His dipeptidase [Hippea alviniae]
MSRVIEIFKEISKIPRCSAKCEKIAEWLCEWAKEHGFSCKKDKALNVLIDVPATEGYESKPVYALQGHMDMVCVKEDWSEHNFDSDPIEVIEEDGWLKANGTTLGADDGVAIAIALAIAEDRTAKHPHLKLLFTSDEEIGLKGALALEEGFFEADRLINIDSETENKFVVGCAGGEDIEIFLPARKGEKRFDSAFRVAISNLKGGHSGQEINKNRANAIKLMKEILKDAVYNLQLCEINGGKARNAIPDRCEAVVLASSYDTLKSSVDRMLDKAKEMYPDEDVKVEIEEFEACQEPFEHESFKKLIDLLDRLPHGVFEMLDKKTPKTSNNLAVVKSEDDRFFIATNQRSLSESGLDEIGMLIEITAREFGAELKRHSRYPSWTPNYQSELLKEAVETYENLFGVKPEIEVIHAGLECGIISGKVKGIDMISVGPDMEGVHTPKERVKIDSIERIYQFIRELLQR